MAKVSYVMGGRITFPRKDTGKLGRRSDYEVEDNQRTMNIESITQKTIDESCT